MDKKQVLGIKVSIFTLLIISFAMLFCPSAENAHADTPNSARNTGKSSVSVAINARIDLEITPNAIGVLNYATANLAISTSQSDGFRVLVSGDSSTLKRTTHPEAPGIPSITTATTLGALSNNTWGIYFGANNPTASSIFLPVTTTQTELVHNEVANASGTYKFAIAAKADTSLPAGYYSNQLVFSVIAEAPAITSLANATYMQDVTPEICSNSDLEVSYTLIDKRDDKTYKVAKLKDGNCWMQENLKLTLSTTDVLTSDDTDLVDSTTYTPPKDTLTQSSASTVGSDMSWHLSGSTGDQWYYQYSTATAGTWKTTSSNQPSPSSICPKGWKLPLAGNTYNDTSGSFYKLFTIYGYSSGNDNVLISNPLNFTRSGQIWVSGITGVGTDGVYLSSVVQNASSYAYYAMLFKSNSVTPYQARAMAGGSSVRCFSYGH